MALVETLCPNQAQPPGQKKGRTGRSKPRTEAKPDKAPANRSAEQPTECVPALPSHRIWLELEVHAAKLCHASHKSCMQLLH